MAWRKGRGPSDAGHYNAGLRLRTICVLGMDGLDEGLQRGRDEVGASDTLGGEGDN